jgi:hypothetical protein
MRTTKQVGGERVIPVKNVAKIIYMYLLSREYKYRKFTSVDNVIKAIQNIMENDDYDFVHRAGKAWDDSYSYEEFLNVFLLFDRFRLKAVGDFLTEGEAKKILENDFDLYEDKTIPQQLRNLKNSYKSMALLKTIANQEEAANAINAEVGKYLSGFNKRSYENQLALLNAKAQKLGVSLAPRENSWTKGSRRRKALPPNNTE